METALKATLNIHFALLVPRILAGRTTESVRVTTHYDHAAHFDKYKTYTLAPPKRGESMSALGEATLRDALRSEMWRRDIAEASGTRADLDVVRHAFIQEKVSVQQYTDWGYNSGSWPYGYGHYCLWGNAPVAYNDFNQYREGTLILDFVDARTGKLVLRGVDKAIVGGPQENAPMIREAEAKMSRPILAVARDGGGAS